MNQQRTECKLAGGQEPEKPFEDYAEGEFFPRLGRTIIELVMKTPTFIVFLDEFGGVQWNYSTTTASAADYSLVSNRVADLEVRSRFLRNKTKNPKDLPISEHQRHLFAARRLIAEGMARLLDSGSLDAVQGILDTAEKWITQRSLTWSRQWLFFPFLGISVAGLIVFLGLVLTWNTLLKNGSPWLWLFGALLGGAGALVSNVIFNRKIPFDATAGNLLHVLEACLRWTVGAVAGLTVQLLIQGDVLLGFLANKDVSSSSALALSLLAGLSELFFPTLLRQFDAAVMNGVATTPQSGTSPQVSPGSNQTPTKP